MEIDKFKREFKCLNGVYASDKVVLLKKPLELYNLATGETIATFDSLDEALAFEIDGKTLEQRVSAWTEIVFPVEHGVVFDAYGFATKYRPGSGTSICVHFPVK